MKNISLLLVLLAALALAPSLSAQTYDIPWHKVAGGGGAGAGGTLGAPTVTKIAAIDSACSVNVLKIRTGDHPENPTMNRGVTLNAEGGSATVAR